MAWNCPWIPWGSPSMMKTYLIQSLWSGSMMNLFEKWIGARRWGIVFRHAPSVWCAGWKIGLGVVDFIWHEQPVQEAKVERGIPQVKLLFWLTFLFLMQEKDRQGLKKRNLTSRLSFVLLIEWPGQGPRRVSSHRLLISFWIWTQKKHCARWHPLFPK